MPKRPVKKSTQKTKSASRPTKPQSVQQEGLTHAVDGIFGFNLLPILARAEVRKSASKAARDMRDEFTGKIIYIGAEAGKDAHKAHVDELPSWQLERYERGKSDYLYVSHRDGPIWLVYPSRNAGRLNGHYGLLDKPPYVRARDGVGLAACQIRDYKLKTLVIQFEDATHEERLGALLGFELAMYEFVRVRNGHHAESLPDKIIIEGATKEEVQSAANLGVATNLARHLTNLPASELNPPAYADAVAGIFSKMGSAVEVDVMDEDRLKQERMNLLLAVGKGSATPPRVVHIRYRPKGASTKHGPIAFVGKGVTFDTGGVNLKDGGGMRLMKKDMGGSAAICGFAWWMIQAGIKQSCDFYLSLAENAVDGASFRPGDVIKSRSGKTVEIHNTDAEGRLVMADVFDYALAMKDKDAPAQLINVATLTGAIKVALGVDLAGLFSNNDELADKILAAGQRAGDRCWRMPLWQDYRGMLVSSTADMANASAGGFGGAITAALFLESFVQQRPWAHLDIYAWTDRPQGAFKEVGATGQGVQMLARIFHPSLKT